LTTKKRRRKQGSELSTPKDKQASSAKQGQDRKEKKLTKDRERASEGKQGGVVLSI